MEPGRQETAPTAPDLALLPHQLPSGLWGVQVLGWASPLPACPDVPALFLCGRVALVCPWHRPGRELGSAHQNQGHESAVSRPVQESDLPAKWAHVWAAARWLSRELPHLMFTPHSFSSCSVSSLPGEAQLWGDTRHRAWKRESQLPKGSRASVFSSVRWRHGQPIFPALGAPWGYRDALKRTHR